MPYLFVTPGICALSKNVCIKFFQLRDLGHLCGLMPGSEPTSEQLHTVVGLSAGMGDSQGSGKSPTPTDKLKEALSSKEAFKKHYLVSDTCIFRNFHYYICVSVL